MTITINRKRVEISKVFSSVEDFVDYLKENYNKLNFDNPKIKSSIEEIYQKMINGDGNLKRDRLG